MQENGVTGFEAGSDIDVWGTAVKNHRSTSFGVCVGHSYVKKPTKSYMGA